MTTNSPNPVDGDVQALNELVAAFYPQYGTPGSRDVDITARRKFIDQSAAAIAEAFRELQQEKSRLEDIARHANRGWKHAYETTKRAEAAEAEVQRLNATAQPVSDGWVKCSERMPVDGKEVLCAYKGSGQGVHIWHGHHWDEGDFDSSIFGNLITHWMPLPAAPGGQGD